MDLQLAGSTAVVLGAGGGIGRPVCRRLLAEGVVVGLGSGAEALAWEAAVQGLLLVGTVGIRLRDSQSVADAGRKASLGAPPDIPVCSAAGRRIATVWETSWLASSTLTTSSSRRIASPRSCLTTVSSLARTSC